MIYACLKVSAPFTPPSDGPVIPYDKLPDTIPDEYGQQLTIGYAPTQAELEAFGEVLFWQNETGTQGESIDRIINPDAPKEEQVTVRASMVKYWGLSATEKDVRPRSFAGVPWLAG